MKCLSILGAAALMIAPIGGCRAEPSRAEPKRGDTYALTLTRDMAQYDNRGGKGSSHDEYSLIERVTEVRTDGLELEYDLPREASPQERAREPHLPARVFKPTVGSIQLLNQAEVEARIQGWLKSGGMTRANCGQLIFTWNAFRIDCDPQSVIGTIQKFDLTTFEAREGASYQDPNAQGSAVLTRSPSGLMLVAQIAVDPDVVRRGRAETDVGVAQLIGKSLTFEEAMRERARDTVSGTISVAFRAAPAGEVRRRTTVTKLEIRRPDGHVETETITETLDRRKIG